MRMAFGFGGGRDWAGAATFVQEAEMLGVEFCWTAENWGFDAATPIVYLAGKT